MLKNYTANNNVNSQNPKIIRKLVEEDFKECFKANQASHFDPIITHEENLELYAQISDQEIKEAVF